MGITIQCTGCQAQFAGKPEYVGRRIRCPKCATVFRVQTPEPPPVMATVAAGPAASPVAESATEAAPSPRPKNKYFGVEIDEWNVPDDFEYTVSEQDDAHAGRCVYCHGEMRPTDILCLKCGYNRDLRQKLSTKTGDEVFAEEERKLAANSISFAGLSLSKKSLMIGSGAAALVALILLLFAPALLAVLLLLGGSLLMLAGHIGVIYVAFQEGAGQGLLVWFLPIYWWVYVYSRWEETALPFILWAIGFAMLLAAMVIGWSIAAEDAQSALITLRLARF
jgi:hypothetical protein